MYLERRVTFIVSEHDHGTQKDDKSYVFEIAYRVK